MDLTTHSLPSQEEMYKAFMDPKSKKKIDFYVGVISSGVFNTSECLSKKPLKENMIFFSSTKEALDYGYRPCLLCKPMLYRIKAPEKYEELLAEIDHDPNMKLEEEDLIKMDIEPNKLTRWFQKHHGITFFDYLKYQRINHLFGNIRFDSHPKIHRSYHYGEIVHGVNEGDSTETIVNKKIIYINRIVTPIGPVLVGAVDEGICMLEFTDRHSLENQLEVLEKHFDAVLTPGKNKHFIQLLRN